MSPNYRRHVVDEDDDGSTLIRVPSPEFTQTTKSLLLQLRFCVVTNLAFLLYLTKGAYASTMETAAPGPAVSASVGAAPQSPSLGGYTYSSVFEFERNFNDVEAHHWMKKNWQKSILYSAIYLIVIFGGQELMKNRPRLELRPLLTIWNVLLAVFSIMGAIRSWPEFMYLMTTHGFYHTVCISTMYKGISGFWTYMFVMSKPIELGDTIFIILRKQQLIFLHWYHHITVLIYVWYSYMDYTAPGQWFLVMNYTVHALMYTYYAFRSMKFKISKWVMMTITTLQLVQMVIGCVIAFYTYIQMRNGVFCNQTKRNLIFCLLLYFSYFVLFAIFFYTTYISKNVKDKIKTTNFTKISSENENESSTESSGDNNVNFGTKELKKD